MPEDELPEDEVDLRPFCYSCGIRLPQPGFCYACWYDSSGLSGPSQEPEGEGD